MKHNPGFLTDDELVERFSVRQAELQELVEVFSEPPGSANNHQLIVGPRGFGKTTLVRRVAIAIRRDPALRTRWLPIVFGEEAYEVLSAAELWLEALLHMAAATGDPLWEKHWRRLRSERDEQRLQARALGLLREHADRHGVRLVLIIENLDALFEQLSSDEVASWRLREVWMNDPRFFVLATAVRRFRGIDDPQHANFDLFHVRMLSALDDVECAKVWEAVQGEPLGLRRARAVRILTGGNPRLISVIAGFATSNSLEQILSDFAALIDDHTDYFKHNIESMQGKTRKVFLTLADLWDPATSGEVAAAARLGRRETSTMLGRLESDGRIEIVGKRGRASLFQVSERLYNLYYLMRRRGGPDARVRAVVDFLVRFYDTGQLPEVLSGLSLPLLEGASSLHQEYFAMLRGVIQRIGPEHTRGLIEAVPTPLLLAEEAPSDWVTLERLQRILSERDVPIRAPMIRRIMHHVEQSGAEHVVGALYPPLLARLPEQDATELSLLLWASELPNDLPEPLLDAALALLASQQDLAFNLLLLFLSEIMPIGAVLSRSGVDPSSLSDLSLETLYALTLDERDPDVLCTLFPVHIHRFGHTGALLSSLSQELLEAPAYQPLKKVVLQALQDASPIERLPLLADLVTMSPEMLSRWTQLLSEEVPWFDELLASRRDPGALLGESGRLHDDSLTMSQAFPRLFIAWAQGRVVAALRESVALCASSVPLHLVAFTRATVLRAQDDELEALCSVVEALFERSRALNMEQSAAMRAALPVLAPVWLELSPSGGGAVLQSAYLVVLTRLRMRMPDRALHLLQEYQQERLFFRSFERGFPGLLPRWLAVDAVTGQAALALFGDEAPEPLRVAARRLLGETVTINAEVDQLAADICRQIAWLQQQADPMTVPIPDDLFVQLAGG